MNPREKFWTHKLAEATETHAAELRKMSGGGASLRTLEASSRAIRRAERELRKAAALREENE